MTFTIHRAGGRRDHKIACQAKANGEWADDLSFHPDVDEPCQNLHCMPVKQSLYNDRHSFGRLLLQPTALKKGQFTRFGWDFLNWEDHKVHQRNDTKTENGLNSNNLMGTASTRLRSSRYHAIPTTGSKLS